MCRRKVLTRSFLLFLFLFSFKIGYSQVEKFEALYIYNLCNYVQWPENSIGGEFIICVVGNDNVVSFLEQTVKGQKIQNKPVKVVVVNSTSEASGSQVIFVPAKKAGMLKSYSQTGKNALIISHSSDALNQGAGISFFMEASKLKFDLKTDNITKKGLKINSKLSQLASHVQ